MSGQEKRARDLVVQFRLCLHVDIAFIPMFFLHHIPYIGRSNHLRYFLCFKASTFLITSPPDLMGTEP